MFSYSSGELQLDVKGHKNELSFIRMDHANEILLTSSWDSNIKIFKKTKTGFELMR